MNPAWWGIPVVVIIGAVVVWYGWWSDRHATREAIEAAQRPVRDVPGLPPDVGTPTYLAEAEVLATAPTADDTAAALLERRDEASGLDAPLADPSFAAADSPASAAACPAVLVLDAPLEFEADATTILRAAVARKAPLVIVAPAFSDLVLAQLRANARLGVQAVLPVAAPQALTLRRAAALCGGLVVPAPDVRSGWLPAETWGQCEAWLADLDGSWVFVSGRGETPTTPTVDASPGDDSSTTT